MKIFKISQNIPFPIWFAKGLLEYPQFYMPPSYFKTLEKWVNETKPNLNNYTLNDAYKQAFIYYKKSPPKSKENVLQNANTKESKENIAILINNTYYINAKPPDLNTIKITNISEEPKELRNEEWFILTIEYVNTIDNNPYITKVKTKDGKIFQQYFFHNVARQI